MTKRKTFAVISQGCRLNHSETTSLVNEFKQNGFFEVSSETGPDIAIINTCTVTENGDKDTIKLVRKINSVSTKTKIALIGCQAQIKKSSLLDLDNVNWVIGNENKNNTADLIMNESGGTFIEPFQKKAFFQPYSSFDPKHTRVNLKIQDGCDFYCSFCIIPFARGPARSRDFSNIIDDAKALINLGVKELVLTGINLGTYFNSNKTIYDLLEALLLLNKGTRIRISSIEPTTIDSRLITLWKEYPNFCRYLHLPIQSGTDEVLKKMRRKYSRKEFDEFIILVRNEIPDICIGTDVIVGFPGETTVLFEDTYQYLKSSEINYFHVFSYSERTMAHSRKFDNQIKSNIIKERSAKLRALHDEKWVMFMSSKLKQKMNVLFEQEKQGYWVGTTEHFIKVRVKSRSHLKNHQKSVYLDCIANKMIEGSIND